MPQPITPANTAILWQRENESRQARRARERREAKTSPPMVQLLTDTQTRGFIRSLVESRQWWLLPWINHEATELSMEIERRFYAGANDDFLAFLGPYPITAGRKSRMSSGQLAELLSELCSQCGWTAHQWEAVLAEQDILVTVPRDGCDGATLARLAVWHDWLQGAEARR